MVGMYTRFEVVVRKPMSIHVEELPLAVAIVDTGLLGAAVDMDNMMLNCFGLVNSKKRRVDCDQVEQALTSFDLEVEVVVLTPW